MATSPWVQRNLDYAQYAQPRGSQYEGPNPVRDMQDESIHREELAIARAKNAHADHELQGFILANCPLCPSHSRSA